MTDDQQSAASRALHLRVAAAAARARAMRVGGWGGGLRSHTVPSVSPPAPFWAAGLFCHVLCMCVCGGGGGEKKKKRKKKKKKTQTGGGGGGGDNKEETKKKKTEIAQRRRWLLSRAGTRGLLEGLSQRAPEHGQPHRRIERRYRNAHCRLQALCRDPGGRPRTRAQWPTTRRSKAGLRAIVWGGGGRLRVAGCAGAPRGGSGGGPASPCVWRARCPCMPIRAPELARAGERGQCPPAFARLRASGWQTQAHTCATERGRQRQGPWLRRGSGGGVVRTCARVRVGEGHGIAAGVLGVGVRGECTYRVMVLTRTLALQHAAEAAHGRHPSAAGGLLFLLLQAPLFVVALRKPGQASRQSARALAGRCGGGRGGRGARARERERERERQTEREGEREREIVQLLTSTLTEIVHFGPQA